MKVYVTDFYAITRNRQHGYAFRWPKYAVDRKEFDATLKALKKAVPQERRHWNDELKEWWVAEGYDLSAIFVNWLAEIEKVKSQISLPGFEE